MNKTDCGDGARSRIVKFNRHSSRMSQPFLDFLVFEVAAVNTHILWRGLNPSSRMGIRPFCEKIIEGTLRKFIAEGTQCWLRRDRKRPREPKRLKVGNRFSKKEVRHCTPLELRNEYGPVAPDPNIDYPKKNSKSTCCSLNGLPDLQERTWQTEKMCTLRTQHSFLVRRWEMWCLGMLFWGRCLGKSEGYLYREDSYSIFCSS